GPRYDYNRTDSNGQNQITGFMASNNVTVRVRDVASTGAVLDAVVTDGANTLNGLTCGLQGPGPQTDEARRRAVADARPRAERFAGAAGVKLGRVLSINEQGGYVPPMPMAMNEGFAKSADVPVEAGALGVRASVMVVYEIAE